MTEPPRPEDGELWREVREHEEGDDVVMWWRWSDKQRRWRWVPAVEAEAQQQLEREHAEAE